MAKNNNAIETLQAERLALDIQKKRLELMRAEAKQQAERRQARRDTVAMVISAVTSAITIFLSFALCLLVWWKA